MVIAGKLFRLKDPLPLDEIALRLKNLKRETPIDDKISLITEVSNLTLNNNRLEGLLLRDVPISFRSRGELVTTVKTLEIPFVFTRQGEETLLLVVEKKNTANWVANLLSELLFLNIGGIVEVRIPPEKLREYHEINAEDSKVVFFEGVDIPNVNKLSLYGSTLSTTSLYNEYLSHGKIWYIVVRSKKHDIVVGLTRDGVVTVFSRIDIPDFIDFVLTEVAEMALS